LKLPPTAITPTTLAGQLIQAGNDEMLSVKV